MELISLREYVLRFDKPIGFYADKLDYHEGQSNAMSYVISYANLLSKQLELWMFVPCKIVEGEWVVLEEPNQYKYWIELQDKGGYSLDLDCKIFKEAKERCVFKIDTIEYYDKDKTIFDFIFNGDKLYFYYSIKEGFLSNHNDIPEPVTIEDLVKYNLELTPIAQKQIGL